MSAIVVIVYCTVVSFKMSGGDNSGKKRNDYKLLVDPELQKGKKKLYRLNGAIPGVRVCTN